MLSIALMTTVVCTGLCPNWSELFATFGQVMEFFSGPQLGARYLLPVQSLAFGGLPVGRSGYGGRQAVHTKHNHKIQYKYLQ